jgi:prolyl oligopeptidase
MNNKIITCFALIFLLANCSNQSTDLSYPDSKKDNLTETIHGYEIEDSYRWLEDFTSEESKDWVNRQNQYTQQLKT